MKKFTSLIIVLLMSLSFLVAPSVFAVLDTKIDTEIFKNAINGKPLEVFVELTGECVVQQATFKGENPINSMELMKSDNKIKSVSLAAILSQKKACIQKTKELWMLNLVILSNTAQMAFCAKQR